jgi:3' terminal RNA ribose 2'-O-methyltransferase Hen1
MYLSLATTHQPATDFGFLLHKNPARLHETELPFGKAFLFYPEATQTRCEAVLVMDVDPVELVRGRGRADGLLDQYVNDRPYAASSFLAVTLSRVLKSAMAGTSRDRQDLADTEIALEAVVTPVPARGGKRLVHDLFEPLGWAVETEMLEGVGSMAGKASPYVKLTLSGTARLRDLLNHLYVLIPVLDDEKHYWVGDDEIAKLMKRGEGWLDIHPAKDLIVRRYLIHRRDLTRAALARLAPETREEDHPERTSRTIQEDALEAPLRLNDARMAAVVEALRASGAKVIADLGCGEGKLLQHLVRERWVDRLIGVDPAARELEWAAKRLKLHTPGGPPEGRVTLLHGSVTYRDRRWEGVDAAALVEVIEHLDMDRLPALEKVVFGAARPATVIVSTPNADYNALFPKLRAGAFRHPDHRFEWSRAQFRAWTQRIGETWGYAADLSGIGKLDDALGAPTQMAIFRRTGA